MKFKKSYCTTPALVLTGKLSSPCDRSYSLYGLSETKSAIFVFIYAFLPQDLPSEFTLLFQEILNNYEIVRANFPNAKLHASTFEAFLEAIQPVVDQLPVVTGEIGDTWISGIASDPRKMAEYRVVMETLTTCIQEGITLDQTTCISRNINCLKYI